MSKFKVALTIGHCKESPGAINQKYGINEYETCKRITDYAANNLSADQGNFDIYLENSDTLQQEKVKIDNFKADVIVENHMNFSWDDNKTGIITVYEKDQNESMLLAFAVHQQLLDKLLRPDLGVINHETVKGWREWTTFFLFDKIKYQNRFGFDVPTILTEIDYISNPNIAVMIVKNDDFVKAAGLAVSNGIKKYFDDKINKDLIA